MPTLIYLEDIAVGDVFTSAEHLLDAEQIKAFARQFDPQPFHLDEDAARHSFFQGLAASGWHTAAITMRLLVDSLPFARGVIGAGSQLTWPQATRPGDVLKVTSTLLSITPSRSKPDRALVEVECVTSNQRGEVLQRSINKVLSFRR